jgi:predicted transcriptional regulator
MSATRTIEIDSAIADELEARAASRGVSVGEMVALDSASQSCSADELAELDRQWARIEAGAATIPHEKVARWLETWGTPGFKPWREQ